MVWINPFQLSFLFVISVHMVYNVGCLFVMYTWWTNMYYFYLVSSGDHLLSVDCSVYPIVIRSANEVYLGGGSSCSTKTPRRSLFRRITFARFHAPSARVRTWRLRPTSPYRIRCRAELSHLSLWYANRIWATSYPIDPFDTHVCIVLFVICICIRSS